MDVHALLVGRGPTAELEVVRTTAAVMGYVWTEHASASRASLPQTARKLRERLACCAALQAFMTSSRVLQQRYLVCGVYT